jgi:hypothetical protein
MKTKKYFYNSQRERSMLGVPLYTPQKKAFLLPDAKLTQRGESEETESEKDFVAWEV